MKTTVPEGLAYAYNLGHVDVFPATSGKENAARYLMERFDASPASSFLLCDDDNDLGAGSKHKHSPKPTFTLPCPYPYLLPTLTLTLTLPPYPHPFPLPLPYLCSGWFA